MPTDSTLPKGNTSKEWLAAADQKMGELRDYASKRRVFGIQDRPTPSDDVYKALSDKELMLRNKGMSLLRQENANAPGYKRGGKVRRSGSARLHKGEMVLRRTHARRSGRNAKRS